MSIHEECGVFGVFSDHQSDVSRIACAGLYALQHRGQESCGIAVNDDGTFVCHKAQGLVSEVFNEQVMSAFPHGSMAVGHTRYATTGSNAPANVQPLLVNHQKGRMALAHNGNLANAAKLRDRLELSGAIFHTTSDTETIAYLITGHRHRTSSIEDALSEAMKSFEGAYSLVLMSPRKLIAARDPHGFRPLCYGKREDGMYLIASESCAITAAGGTLIRDIMPGEILVFTKDGIISRTEHCNKAERRFCIFEYIYFARPDSVIDGMSVHESRVRAGEILAGVSPVDADLVIGVPDSGIDAAIGYSRASGIPFENALIKNKYIGRTFIAPDHRSDQVRIKLSVIESCVRNKKAVLIDDSIVRGTTCRRIVSLLREAGVREVHLRICAPPFLHPCFYGTDIDSSGNLIAARYSTQETARMTGADSLGYLPLECLHELSPHSYCSACFDGNYPTEVPRSFGKNRFERKLSEI
ncbi:MAG: amidophosphoribosyltransferase [Solobacterium sp.]|nr:amidophosphoribosyltransferase [Solobacterium sp.]